MSHEWFGGITSRWPVVPIRSVARLGTGHTPSRLVPEYWENCTIHWVTVEDIREHGEASLLPLTSTRQKISELGLQNSAAVLHPAGTVMLSRTASIGYSCLIGKPMATTQAFVTWTPDSARLDSRYLHAALKAMGQVYDFLAYGSTHLTIYFPDIQTLRIPLPPIPEQRAIARFLDRETAKIDALVEEQRKLIELLIEKRQTLITQAVTKGLDPNVKFKDSGIQWLGAVPQHWSVLQVRRILRTLTDYTANGSFASLADNVTYLDSGYSRLIRLTDLRVDLSNDGVWVDEKAHRFLSKSELQGGELLVANVGAYAGYGCLMPTVNYPATLGPNMFLIQFDTDVITNEYMELYWNSHPSKIQLEMSSTATAQPKLNKDDIRNLWLVVPPPGEQEWILAQCKMRLNEIDLLMNQSEKAEQLLLERRSSLISAAVTGKIDVRDMIDEEATA